MGTIFQVAHFKLMTVKGQTILLSDVIIRERLAGWLFRRRLFCSFFRQTILLPCWSGGRQTRSGLHKTSAVGSFSWFVRTPQPYCAMSIIAAPFTSGGLPRIHLIRIFQTTPGIPPSITYQGLEKKPNRAVFPPLNSPKKTVCRLPKQGIFIAGILVPS